MKAIVYRSYGPPEVLRLEDIEKPIAADNEVVVKVHAAGVNPLDWHYMRGTPYIMRFGVGMSQPTSPRFGVDFAGSIEAVGKNVKLFKPGDAVFGGSKGAFAEYVSVREDGPLFLKPTSLSFEQAASVPIAAITALQAMRDKGRIQARQKVLINGASGGVGTFAVQIAKSYGAEVTGVCSTRNVELVRSIGADHVIDYTQENYTRGVARYDLIVDMVGNHSLLNNRRVLSSDGNFVIIGGSKGKWLGPMAGPIKALFLAPFVSQTIGMMLAKLNPQDLNVLRDLLQTRKVTPVIDRTYKLSEVSDAIRYLEEGHARGKVVISMASER
ncbi:MAG: NAD(P)-dependent alcohol dehydrogenase [Gammaproteobacteria bacterium]